MIKFMIYLLLLFYRDLFVHGFAVDEKNNKMSKSIGNVVDPEEITKGGKDLNKKPVYGVDVLRYKNYVKNSINEFFI